MSDVPHDAREWEEPSYAPHYLSPNDVETMYCTVLVRPATWTPFTQPGEMPPAGIPDPHAGAWAVCTTHPIRNLQESDGCDCRYHLGGLMLCADGAWRPAMLAGQNGDQLTVGEFYLAESGAWFMVMNYETPWSTEWLWSSDPAGVPT